MPKINRRWEKNNGNYELYGSFYNGEEQLVATLSITHDPLDGGLFATYSSSFTDADDEFLDCDSEDEAKEMLESVISEYFSDMIAYYKTMLEFWNETSDKNAPLPWIRVNELETNNWTNEFECPYCKRHIHTPTYLSPNRSPDYEHCPHCGYEVS